MIRNVVVHISNEQPMLVDIYSLPTAADAGLLCTNMRLMDGKRPVFIDAIENTFFFPYRAIRFLEIPVAALSRHQAEGGRGAPGAAASEGPNASGESLPGDLETSVPIAIEAPADESADDLDLGEEIDEDFLRRIRDI